jgi:hypothetical protein
MISITKGMSAQSEYDILSTYSRRLRRTATLLMGAGAVLAGAFSMTLIIALPLQPHRNAERERATTVVSPAKNSTAAAFSQKDAQPSADTAAKTTTGKVETQNSAEFAAAAGLGERGAANPKTADAPTTGLPKAPVAVALRETSGAQPLAARAASMRDKPSNETKNAMVKTIIGTSQVARESGSATTPVHLEMTVETSPDSFSTDRRTRKKHAYKRKPQNTRLARPGEDLRYHPFVEQSGVRQVSERYYDGNARAMVAPGPRRFTFGQLFPGASLPGQR